MKPCDDNQDLMMRRLDGALNLVEQSTLDAHLRECPRCTRDCGYLLVADGLLRAVDAPKVSAEEWAVVETEIAKAAGAEDDLRVAAGATEPPPVSREEWDGVWQGIEREALLGKREEKKTIDIRTVRKRAVWQYGVAIAAAAVVVLGIYLVVGMMHPRAPRPTIAADEVQVGKGYAYTTIKTESAESIYVIAQINNIEYVSASTKGGFMYSTENNVMEIAPKSALTGPGGGPVEVPPKP